MIKTLSLGIALAVVCMAQAQQLSDLTFGPQQESSGKTLDDIVAVVGTDIITRRELNRSPGNNKAQALQALIMRKLLLQTAKQHNITVGDTAVNMAMKEKANRHLSRDTVRERLLISKLQQQVVNSRVNISEMEVADMVEAQLKKSTDSVKLIDILVKVPKTADTTKLSQARHKAKKILKQLAKQSPQSVASQYADVTFNDLGWAELSKIPAAFSKPLLDAPVGKYLPPIVDRDGIHLLKVLDKKQKNTKNAIRIPETLASHILIRGQNNPMAKKQINDIYQQLKQGADFAELAKQYSQDPGSSAKGGDLGWVSPGQMVPAFESVMNNTQTGAISKPFTSAFGYHIVKVNKRRQTSGNNRQALEKQARKAIFQRRAAEEWELWLSQLRDEGFVEIRQRP